jgi:SAM-dependent methyltransferase
MAKNRCDARKMKSTVRKIFHRVIPSPAQRWIRRCLKAAGWEHRFLRLRRPGFAMFQGEGIEIGAFEHPAPLAPRCVMHYVDAITPAQAAILFPEVDATALVVPDYIMDVSNAGLSVFSDGKWDFAVACHVIEHLPNPGRVVGELFRVVRPGGLVAIAAPDKRFTFDTTRPETSISMLHRYFSEGRTLTPADYEDISRYVNVSDLALSESKRRFRLEEYRDRREHLNVWTSASFRQFWIQALKWNGIAAEPVYEMHGEQSRFEYFGVWRTMTS